MKNILQSRTSQYGIWAIVFSMTLMIIPCVVLAVCEEESELVCSETTLHMDYGQYTSGCVISPTADVDTFEFDGVAGDPVRVICSGLSNNFDCRIEVWDPDGIKIMDASCSASTFVTCSASGSIVLPLTGSYDMAISDSGNDNSGSYSLNLEELPPDDAQNLGYDTTETCSTSPHSDIDKFDFDGNMDTTVRLVVSGRTNNLDPVLEVWGPDGSVVASGSCDASTFVTCSFYRDVPLPMEGMYSLSVRDGGYDNTGTYELQLQCILGGCPLCTDIDNDGYGNPASPNCSLPDLDCNDGNADVNPGATEICENGLDDDCVGGDLTPCPGSCAGGPAK